MTLTAPGERAHEDKVHGGMCPCTPEGGIAPGVWNSRLPKRWNRFMQQLKRHHGGKLSYFRAIEAQSRGALHEHVIICSPDPSRPLILRVATLRKLAIEHGYGHSLRLDKVSSSGGAASYVSKYVSKSCDARSDVPWVSERTGEFLRARYRPWSASRDWGIRMAAVREAQRAWARTQDEAPSLDNNTQSYTADDYENGQTIAHLRSAGLIDGDG